MLPFTSFQLKARERSSWLVMGRELTLPLATGYAFVLMKQVSTRVAPLLTVVLAGGSEYFRTKNFIYCDYA